MMQRISNVDLMDSALDIMTDDYALATSGIWHCSSGFLPQREHSPRFFFIIGLLVAQVPRNSLPVTMCLILIIMNDMPKTTKTIKSVDKNDPIIINVTQKYSYKLNRSIPFTY